jgi:hypothetical protein
MEMTLPPRAITARAKEYVTLEKPDKRSFDFRQPH